MQLIRPSEILTFVDLIKNTDWKLLQKQKEALVQLTASYSDDKTFDGIIAFLNSIQDLAVEGYSFPEEIIFPPMVEQGVNGGKVINIQERVREDL
jgi:hypothetical protein